MPLVTRIGLNVASTYSTTGDLSTVRTIPWAYEKIISLASGVGLNQADKLFVDQRTVTTGAIDSLDLAGGGLLDVDGAPFAPARIKGLILFAATANTTILSLTRPANGVPFLGASGDLVTAHAGSLIMLAWPSAAGIVVTAATGDLIDIVNAAGASAVYDIAIWGASA